MSHSGAELAAVAAAQALGASGRALLAASVAGYEVGIRVGGRSSDASCRHTHPAAGALAQVMQQHGLRPDELRQVAARRRGCV